MPDGHSRRSRLESEVREMKLEEEDMDEDMDTIAVAESVKRETSATASGKGSGSGTPLKVKSLSRSPIKRQSVAASPAPDSEEDEETIGGDVTVKMEPGKPPKLSRTTAHKVEKRPPQLFLDYEDKTAEASATFNILPECTYANKYLGTTEPALECDCVEEWGKHPYNLAIS